MGGQYFTIGSFLEYYNSEPLPSAKLDGYLVLQ